MVNDLALGREKQQQFEEWRRAGVGKQLDLDLTVTVLTTGFWPTYKVFHLPLPVLTPSRWH